MANKRTRWVTLEVYPDNPEQVAAFDWIRTDPAAMCSGMYIKHLAEEEGGKDHIHVMLYIDNAIRYKTEGEQNTCLSFASRFGTFDGYYDEQSEKMYYKSRGDELPEGKTWKSYPVFRMVQPFDRLYARLKSLRAFVLSVLYSLRNLSESVPKK